MRLLLFFIVLNVWGADIFDIPKVWRRRLGVNDGTYAPRITPEKLTECFLHLRRTGDTIILQNSIYHISCLIRPCSERVGGMLFKVMFGLTRQDERYNGFVFSSPSSSALGGVTLVPPTTDSIVKKFPLENPAAQDNFCEYAVTRESLTIERSLQQYADGSYYFVGMTFCYDHLDKVKVSSGTKRPNGDGAMVTEPGHTDYDFGSCIQAASVMRTMV